ncbi:Fungalysin metallopeptidase-domain-containing protein [Thelonectria olida]|uniref:Extracellular metalloproteinase n=1 Tax=Thelonectria olida TaxID=1576542 RepID=A0A9P9ANB0_9HYPO|nr:Fungalysin metallopeptidase-domain-containing protein [Thelonectria olida]
MRSLLLLGLAGLAAKTQAHPARQEPKGAALEKRGIDLDAFRLKELADYVPNEEVVEDPPVSLSKRADYLETAKDVVKSIVPKATFRLVEDHYVGNNGIAHVHFKQTVNGVDVDNGDFNVNVAADGTVFSYGNSFFTGTLPSPFAKRDVSDPVDALKGAVDILSLPVDTKDATAKQTGDSEHYTFKGTDGAVSEPKAKLVYLIKPDEKLGLAWRVETDVMDNWLLTYIDATTNEKIFGVVDYVADLATYKVYPWAVNDPTEGSRSVVKDPWNIATSEFTWISDGSSNYTTTRGNNGIAQVNPSGGTSYLNNYHTWAFELTHEFRPF